MAHTDTQWGISIILLCRTAPGPTLAPFCSASPSSRAGPWLHFYNICWAIFASLSLKRKPQPFAIQSNHIIELLILNAAQFIYVGEARYNVCKCRLSVRYHALRKRLLRSIKRETALLNRWTSFTLNNFQMVIDFAAPRMGLQTKIEHGCAGG